MKIVCYDDKNRITKGCHHEKMITKSFAAVLSVAMLTATAGCGAPKLNGDIKSATEHTSKLNQEVYEFLAFSDTREYEFATRGLIDAPESLKSKTRAVR